MGPGVGHPEGSVSDSFRFTIPGQPPSLNRTYRIVRVPHRGGGSHQQLAKSNEAWNYQLVASTLARQAKPSSFNPEGRVRVYWKFMLTRITDSDNLLKILSDALEQGTGINDRNFNHCVRDVIRVKNASEARTEVIVSSDPACRCSVLDEGGYP